jgi:predicted DNA-binding transcriptional regulator
MESCEAMTMDLINSLCELGFSKNEAKVYSTLVRRRQATAEEIARTSGIQRRTVYDLLDGLIQKGVVSFVNDGKRKFFKSASKSALTDILKKRVLHLNQIEKYLSESDAGSESYESVSAEVYRGVEGVKTVMRDILETKQPWYNLGSTGKGPAILSGFANMFQRKRVRAKIPLKILVVNSAAGLKRGRELVGFGSVAVRVLPTQSGPPHTIWVYGDNAAILLVDVSQPYLILIRNPTIAESFRCYFRLLWEASKPLK